MAMKDEVTAGAERRWLRQLTEALVAVMNLQVPIDELDGEYDRLITELRTARQAAAIARALAKKALDADREKAEREFERDVFGCPHTFDLHVGHEVRTLHCDRVGGHIGDHRCGSQATWPQGTGSVQVDREVKPGDIVRVAAPSRTDVFCREPSDGPTGHPCDLLAGHSGEHRWFW